MQRRMLCLHCIVFSPITELAVALESHHGSEPRIHGDMTRDGDEVRLELFHSVCMTRSESLELP